AVARRGSGRDGLAAGLRGRVGVALCREREARRPRADEETRGKRGPLRDHADRDGERRGDLQRLAVPRAVLLRALGLRRRRRAADRGARPDVAGLLLTEVALLAHVAVGGLAAARRVRLALRAGGGSRGL